MKRAMWVNALLAIAVAALGAWAYFKPGREAPVDYALSALKPDAVRSLHIERPGAPAVSLERKGEGWRLTAPFAARADEGRVERLLEILGARTAHRLPAADLARFELDRPQARLTIDRQAFSFGMVSEVTREQYILTDGAVFPLHPRHGAALPAQAAELASRRLFAPGEAPVGIALKAFTVTQRDGQWEQAPAAADAGQDDFLRWVEQWRLAAAARVEPFTRGKTLETIGIGLKDGRALKLDVLGREPELALSRPDEKLVYYFRADVAKRLLSPPGAAVAPAKQ